MYELGFPERFVGWVMSCLSSVSYSILVNCKPSVPYEARKGLRQGDHTSPFLLSIRMEYLTRCLDTINDCKLFSHHPRCRRNKIIHLMFTDDLLLFPYGDREPVGTLMK